MDRSWPSRARGWAAVVVVALVAACTSGGGEPEGAARPEEAAGGLVWTRSDAPSLRTDRRGGTLGEIITAPGGGFLVAGTVFDADGRPSPTVWASPDGERWEASELPADGGARLWAAASAKRTTVVAGQAGADRRGPAVAYVAPPDAGFELVDDPVLDQPGLVINTLAGGTGGFLAVGARRSDPDKRTAVFHSDDGQQWRALDGADDLLAEASGSVVGAAAMGPGGLVMVGSIDGPSGRIGVVWHSADGTTWAQAATFSGASDVAMNTVAVLRDGFVAAGHEEVDGLREPRVWRSRDGRAWEPVEAEFELLGSMTDNVGVTVRALDSANGWMAAGGGSGAERLWRGSHDLRSWTEVPLPPGPAGVDTPAFDLLATRASATLVGASAAGRPVLLREADDTVTEITATETAFPEPGAEVWIHEAVTTERGPLLLGAVATEERAVGRRRRLARVWRPDPEQGWRQVGGDELDQAVVNDVADLGGELVGVGHEAPVDAVFTEVNPRGVVWRSADAESWARVTGPGIDALRGDSTTTIEAAVAVGGGVVAVGHELPVGQRRIQAAFWWASTPEAWERTAVGAPPEGIGETVAFAVCPLGDSAVAVGLGSTPQGEQGMAWVGGAGREWEATTPEAMAGPGDWYARACVTTPETVVVVGRRGALESDAVSAGVWASTDGRTWTAVESPSFSGDGPRRLWSVAADDRGRLYAVGEYEREGWTSPGLWRSHDGTEWELVELPEELFRGDDYEAVNDVAVVDGELVLVGVVDDDAAVWTAPLPADWSD